jgi:hypothetical protein
MIFFGKKNDKAGNLIAVARLVVCSKDCFYFPSSRAPPLDLKKQYQSSSSLSNHLFS